MTPSSSWAWIDLSNQTLKVPARRFPARAVQAPRCGWAQTNRKKQAKRAVTRVPGLIGETGAERASITGKYKEPHEMNIMTATIIAFAMSATSKNNPKADFTLRLEDGSEVEGRAWTERALAIEAKGVGAELTFRGRVISKANRFFSAGMMQILEIDPASPEDFADYEDRTLEAGESVVISDNPYSPEKRVIAMLLEDVGHADIAQAVEKAATMETAQWYDVLAQEGKMLLRPFVEISMRAPDYAMPLLNLISDDTSDDIDAAEAELAGQTAPVAQTDEA